MFLVFLKSLERGQRKYVQDFKQQTIEMDDFTLRISNLPDEEWVGRDTSRMKEYLHDHFRQLINHLNNDPENEANDHVADINFGEYQSAKLGFLSTLANLRADYIRNKIFIEQL